MKYKDLRDFVGRLETLGELRRIPQAVSPVLEMTELCDRVLRAGGPACCLRRRQSHAFPVLGNLFGTPRRVALGMGIDAGEQDVFSAIARAGVAARRRAPPVRPQGAGAAQRPEGRRQVAVAREGGLGHGAEDGELPPCQEIVWEGQDVDLARLPIQTCWPGDAGPLITWGLTVTRGPNKTPPEPGHLSPATDRT
jgi:4-hydroxy-3-polyprenylbenzoate decarboxylase